MQAHAQAARQDSRPPAGAESPADERALRLIGVSDDGDRVLCVQAHDADVAHPEADATRYTLAIDERLRAAVRGSATDDPNGAQGEADMAPGLRPREIQNRIRAGATVEQVAAAAGCPVDRIEGFAYPVLQERAAVTEKARAAFPLKGSNDTLEDIVTATLVDRGQRSGIEWDAFKDERGWVVALTWQAGRSENRAEWAFTARPGGGSVTALGAEAADLLEPGRSTLRPVDQLTARDGGYDAAAGQRPAPHADTVVGAGGSGTPPPANGAGQESVQRTGPDTSTPATRSPRRGHRPQMPSWEDVLLGTRTAEH